VFFLYVVLRILLYIAETGHRGTLLRAGGTTDLRPLQPGIQEGSAVNSFVSSLIVSHYSTTYIFCTILVRLLIGSTLLAARKKSGTRTARSHCSTDYPNRLFLALGWYTYVAGGAALGALSEFGSNTAAAFSTELFSTGNPQVASGLGIGVLGLPFTHALANYWVNAQKS